jgi:hypothetical protein
MTPQLMPESGRDRSAWCVCRLRATGSGGSGSVLVELVIVEQRYRAVLAVLPGSR